MRLLLIMILNYSEIMHFEATAGLSFQKVSGNTAGSSSSRDDVPFNSGIMQIIHAATGNKHHANGQPQVYTPSGVTIFNTSKRNASVFGRINYDYNDKYLVSLTGRRDGSTVLGKDQALWQFLCRFTGLGSEQGRLFSSQNFINFLENKG